MFDLIIHISRYLFALYMVIFLLNGAACILDITKKYEFNTKKALSRQRIVIILNHITAFLILSYYPGEFRFNYSTLIIGICGLIFLIAGHILTSLAFRNGSKLMFNCVFFLLDIGFIMLMRLNTALAIRQIVWITAGLLIMLMIPWVLNIFPRFEKFEKLYIALGIFLIVLTFILGKEEFGSVNWIKIGSFGFQPSEIVKFLFIFYLASVFRKRVEFKELILTGVLSAVIVIGLVLQKDLGGALIFFITYLTMLYISTSNTFLFMGGLAGASLAATLAYNLFSHVRVRVMAWKNPWADIDKGGYKIAQSLFAITTWGFFGCGLTKCMPKSIPVVEKDFIFSAICEEFGVLFAIGVISVFIIIFTVGMITALRCERRYYSLIVIGINIMLAFQTFLIIGGVTKFIPLTGVTLPFISYGGSSIIISIAMIGLIQWVYSYQLEHDELDEIKVLESECEYE